MQQVGSGAKPSLEAKVAAVLETEKERADRLRTAGEVAPSLSKDFGLADLGASLEVTTFVVREALLDANGAPTPVWLWRESGKRHCPASGALIQI